MKKEKRKLRIYFFGDNTGVGWYRIHSPARWLKKLNLADVRTSDWRWTVENDKIKFPTIDELLDIGYWADLIVFQRHDMPQYMGNIMGVAEHFNIPVVLDTDDNIEAVRPHNPGYKSYHPGSEAMAFGRLAPKKAFALSVTTRNLKHWHAKDNANIEILPNSLDVEWRGKFKKNINPKGEIHIGWIASGGHLENGRMIKDAVLKILEKYPNVFFHYMKMYGDSIWQPATYDEKIRRRMIQHDWATLKEWPAFLASLGLDIGLAPAVDNLFNRAKSNLRYLEYSFVGTASILSPTECYECVKHGKTGLFALEKEDWFDEMEKLITNQTLRESIQEKSKQDVLEHYDMKHNAHLWVDYYEKIVKKFKKQNGAKHFVRLQDF